MSLRRPLYGFVLLVATLLPVAALSQKIQFNLEAPAAVPADEVFRIEFILENARPENFTPPDFAGFDVIAGPSPSQGQRGYVSGSNVVQHTYYSYGYVLRARDEGILEIGPATVTVDGKIFSTAKQPIEVIRERKTPPPGGDQPQGGQQRTGTIAGDDILVRAIVDRSEVYRGQPVKVTFKIYSRVPLRVENARQPAFNGFWTQETDVSGSRPIREAYNNKIYDALIFREFLLYPQQSGTLQIDPYELAVAAQIVTQQRRQSLLDEIFGGGPQINEIRKRVSSNPVRITVKELPADAPASFNGAVGNFTMEAGYDTEQVELNAAYSYIVRITGSGNLPLVQSPKVELPAVFEQYNIRTTESFNTGVNGITGYRQFEYPFIARSEGEFVTEPVYFSYFDPEKGEYVTLSSAESTVVVDPSSGIDRSVNNPSAMITGRPKEDLKILGQDIRFIKIGRPGVSLRGDLFVSGPVYPFLVVVIVLAGGVAYLVLKKYRTRRNNLDLLRGRRANKMAVSRLKNAREHMQSGDNNRFYDEMLRVLWGYIGDKLNIPAANLSKDKVRQNLLHRGVSADIAEQYIELIAVCEMAQYSPADSGSMTDVYTRTADIITNIETHINKRP